MPSTPPQTPVETHTPGPWTWNNRGTELCGVVTYVTGTQGTEQVLCIDLPEFIEPENKALISASPDLLAACKVALELLERYAQGAEDTHALIRAAITKAETPVFATDDSLDAYADQNNYGRG